MSGKSVKQMLFEQFARVAKAMANPNRLELLEFLAQGERGVEELAKLASLNVANTSQHLQRLRQAGLVSARADGHRVIYSLADQAVVGAMGCIRSVAERTIAEVNQLVETYLKLKDDLEPIPAEELLLRARQGLVTILDVRPVEEFRAGHLPGAINMPLSQLEKHIGSLSVAKEIVAYCRGPYCVLAYDAVARLREKGFKAHRLENGFPEWRYAGHPVESGSA